MNIITPLIDTGIKDFLFILDPLSTIIKLAIISKKPIGCKISIKNNIMTIQQVGIFQGIVRYYLNDTKNDIHYMLNAIEHACKIYINKYNKINNLFKSGISGLQILIETYKEFPIIVHCLNYYISIINNYLGTNHNNLDKNCLNLNKKNNNVNKKHNDLDKNEINTIIDNSNTILNNNNLYVNLELYPTDLLSLLNNRWTESKIYIIIEMIEFINNNNNVSTNYIESFMNEVDNDTQQIINTYYLE